VSEHNPLFEKHGNTVWLTCPSCGGWFHVSRALLNHEKALLFCPHCRDSFKPDEAEKIVHP
jgi:hypothetical protein